jgi:hypothetical protein
VSSGNVVRRASQITLAGKMFPETLGFLHQGIANVDHLLHLLRQRVAGSLLAFPVCLFDLCRSRSAAIVAS